MDVIVTKIADYCAEHLPLSDAKLSDEYYYHSLPFAVTDAIFSIGARYTSTRNTVIRYCRQYHLQRIRNTKEFPPENEQHKISDFITNMESIDQFAETIFQNKQRTSTKNGILKADAALAWAKILKCYQIETLQDFNEKYSAELESDLKNVAGQSSGISIMYLKMLCGNDNGCKPDRHVLRFIQECSGVHCSPEQAFAYLRETCQSLKKSYPDLNLRLLDHIIWRYMSAKK